MTAWAALGALPVAKGQRLQKEHCALCLTSAVVAREELSLPPNTEVASADEQQTAVPVVDYQAGWCLQKRVMHSRWVDDGRLQKRVMHSRWIDLASSSLVLCS